MEKNRVSTSATREKSQNKPQPIPSTEYQKIIKDKQVFPRLHFCRPLGRNAISHVVASCPPCLFRRQV